jgi:hypothetical protein
MRLLVLGGTRFVGHAVVSAALGRGWEVATFNRGLSGPTWQASAFSEAIVRGPLIWPRWLPPTNGTLSSTPPVTFPARSWRPANAWNR